MSNRIKRYIIGLIVTAVVSKVMYSIFGLDEETA